MHVQFLEETDLYQIHETSRLSDVINAGGRLTCMRGESARFLEKDRLFIDLTFADPDGRLAIVLLVELASENGITVTLPSRLETADANLLRRIITEIENYLVKAFGQATLPNKQDFFIEDNNIPLDLAETSSELLLPGRTPYDKLLPYLDHYRLAATLIQPGQRILDIGCGCGAGMALLTAADARCGVDQRDGAIALSERILEPSALQLISKRAEELELMRGYDLVIGHLAGSSIDKHQEVIDAAVRHMNRDASLFICIETGRLPSTSKKTPCGMSWNAERVGFILSDRFSDVSYITQAGKNVEDLALAWAMSDGADDNGEMICAIARNPKTARKFPDVSIVIPAFNKIEFTDKSLNALKDRFPKEMDHEVIVIDNGSSDSTPEVLAEKVKSWGPFLRVVRNETNIGFARASNQGALLARGRIIVFLNNDTEVQDGWLAPLIDEIDTHGATGLAGGRLLFPNGTIQHAGVAVGRKKVPFHIHRGEPKDSPLVTERRVMPMVTAACVATRRQEFLNNGLLDEEFVNGHEDIDLCLRYRQNGKECVYRPDCVVVHHEEISEGRLDNRDQNLLRLFDKWHNDLIQDDFSFAFPPSAIEKATSPLRFSIKIGVPNRSIHNWGDIFFAEGLAKALAGKGHKCRIDYLNEWGGQDLDTDVVIHIKGLSEYKPKPHNINIMWMINHPSLHTDEELSRYDALLVASLPYAKKLSERLQIPVLPFPQATDPVHFHPYPDIEKRFDLVFVGNNQGTDRLPIRQIVADLLPTKYRLGVWGDGWSGRLPVGIHQRNFVPNDELPKIYASGRIVLNDHQPEMKAEGFVNNRTFDVVASGSILISDAVNGLEEILPVHIYRTADELKRVVNRILRNYRNEEKRAAEMRKRVIENFTFSRRADEILGLVSNLPKVRERAGSARVQNERIVIEKNPLVSILVSTYNRRQFLPDTLRSIKAQTHGNWELILVNDGGEPVDDIVIRENDTRIKLISLDRNHGKAYAINRAFEQTRGEFIAYQDDDDIWYPDHLERLLFPLLTIPGIDFAYSAAVDVTYDGRDDGTFFATKRELVHDKQVNIGDLLFQNHIQGIIVVHRRDLFVKVGGMDEKLKVLIDWDLWRRMAALCYPYHVDRATADRTLRGWTETAGVGHLTSLHKTNPPAYFANRLRILRKPLALHENSPLNKALADLRRQGESDFLLARGEAFEQKGDFRRAGRAYERGLRHCPDSIVAMRKLGLLAMKGKRLEEACRMLTRILNDRKADFKDHLYATYSCLATDRKKDALLIIADIENKFPSDVKANCEIISEYRQRALN